MKKIISILVFALLALRSISQNKVMMYEQAEKNGIKFSVLDSIYPVGLNINSTKSVFWDNQDEFKSASQKTVNDLAKYLKENKFSPDKKTQCFCKIYFNKNGQIDYFLYNFSKDEITLEKQKQFDNLINEFIKKYTFPLKAKTGFSQSNILRLKPLK